MLASMRYRIVLLSLFVGSCCCGLRGASGQDEAKVNKTQWHGEAALGLSVTQGNSKTLTGHGSASATKLLTTDEFRLGADGAYGLNNLGATNETRNAENVHGFAEWKHLFTERLYGDLRVDAMHDDVADLQNRELVGPAIGDYFIKSDRTRLSAEVGAGYEHQRQNGQDSNFITMRVGERGECSFTKAWKGWEEITYLPKVDDFMTYLLIAEVGTEAALNAHLSLRVVFDDTYNSKPALGKVPNDLALITSVVWKY